jgi:hypothetical protein
LIEQETGAMSGRAALLLILAGCVAGPADEPNRNRGVTKGRSAMMTDARGRTGAVQGPLLMGEDFEADLKAMAGAEATGDCTDLIAELKRYKRPTDNDWEMPEMPDSGGGRLTGRPFRSGCRTVGLGIAPVKAEAFEGRRGTFDVLCSAGAGQYSYTVSSPCTTYRAEHDGWVAIEFAVVVNGLVLAKLGDGAGAVEVGLYAAHCWPKEKGKYWQEPRHTLDESGELTLENEVLTLTSVFPVESDTKYSFGTGLTTTAWAKDGAMVGTRLWGRLAYVKITKTDMRPAELPYSGDAARGEPLADRAGGCCDVAGE